MSRLMIMSDLHLGHSNICKYREGFSSAQEHHETLFENLATNVGKRDTLYLLGDIAFTLEWLERIKTIKARHKLLVVGNHDTERGITMRHLVDVYDSVVSLFSKRNYWFSHAPIHSDEIRRRFGNIHGHCHGHKIDDKRYINACVEHTNYKPITFEELVNE